VLEKIAGDVECESQLLGVPEAEGKSTVGKGAGEVGRTVGAVIGVVVGVVVGVINSSGIRVTIILAGVASA